ncbi:MAG: GNAT family N-acetyltransferase [Acholeplasmatales bacterium]|jgi:putative acetyltransferase|nr:GNAT family N-acetyltransferase [Acholeplasmatales bacterium]
MKKLKTPRLILREPKISDIKDFYEYAKDPEVGPRAGWAAHENIEQSYFILESFIAHQDVWTVYHKKDHKMIGSIGLHLREGIYELGYVLNQNYWHQGLMSEALNVLLAYFFQELAIEEIYVSHYPDNLRSQRVIEKQGFKYLNTTEVKDSPYSKTKLNYCLKSDDYWRIHHAGKKI